MPSDTIYGLSCRALNESAVKRLHKLKVRDKNKPFVILISNYEMFDLLGVRYNKVITTVGKYWPGALTVIFPAPAAPGWLQLGTGSLAVRLPADNALRNLIEETGPIISTSANPEGKSPTSSVAEAKKYFGEQLDFYVDAGVISGRSSTLVKVENEKLVVVRQGRLEVDTQ